MQEGALVTNTCLFNNDYPYALDIYWSCGSEQLDQPLRLHTFKRHSYSHQQVFADQLVTYNNKKNDNDENNFGGQLWFNAYNPPLCVRVDYDDNNNEDGAGNLKLSTNGNDCSQFTLLSTSSSTSSNNNTAPPDVPLFYLQDVSTGGCAGLGDSATTCDSDQSTGGSECGNVDHRYLPLQIMNDCNTDDAEEKFLAFYFATHVKDCSNGSTEWPDGACF